MPESWVEKIFAVMLASYGAKFTDLWRGTDLAAVKAMWATKLSGFAEKPEAIKAALDALDERPFPPTLPEFVTLCRDAARRTGTSQPALQWKPDPEKQRQFSAELATILKGESRGRDPIFWATHPRSDGHLATIIDAARKDPVKFQPCLEKLKADGIIADDGKLLCRYTGHGQWEKV